MTSCCCCCPGDTNSNGEIVSTSSRLIKPLLARAGPSPALFSVSTEEEEVGSKKKKLAALATLSAVTPLYTIVTSPELGIPCIDRQTQLTVAAGLRHDPDGITWITGAQWAASTWDGVTTWDPCTLTKAQLLAAIWPSTTNVMRGLRELFYSVNPFANNLAPTPKEIENWNLAVINHYRAMLGITAPAVNDRGLYLEAHWADERKNSTYWDAAYPGTLGSAYGPCVGMSPINGHCGSTFIPTCEDQLPYLHKGEACKSRISMAEGVFTTNQNIPWSIKLSRILSGIVQGEGITGHGGPFVSREKVGISWRCDTGNSVQVRIKWGGTNTAPCP